MGELGLSDPPLGSFSPDDGAGGVVADSRPRPPEITYWPPPSGELDVHYANRPNVATVWTPDGGQLRPVSQVDIAVPPRRRLPAYLTASVLAPVPVTSTTRTPRRRRHSEAAEAGGIERCCEDSQNIELCELTLPGSDDFE